MARKIQADLVLESNSFTSGIKQQIKGMEMFVSSMKKANTNMKHLEKPIKMAVDTKKAMNNITSVAKKIGSMTNKSCKITMVGVDKISGSIGKVKSELVNLKTLAGGIVLGAGAKAVGNWAVGGAGKLEQEQIAMEHFIGNASVNKGKDVKAITNSFIDGLRKEANATPFATSEVIAAGRRAVNVVQGDTNKAMELVKLSEDMAALNPGKTVMDAMEALADMKVGEFERMKEFGFKFSQKEFKGLVGKGEKDDLSNDETNTAYDNLVKNKLNPTFSGGAEKLSHSAFGKWSTVVGNFENIGTNLGTSMLPNIQKTLDPLITLLENFEKTEAFENIKKNLEAASNIVATKLTTFINDLNANPEKVDNFFKGFGEGLRVVADIFKTFGAVAREVWTIVEPLFNWIKENPAAAAKLFIAYKLGVPILKGVGKGFSGLKKGMDSIKGFEMPKGLKELFKNKKMPKIKMPKIQMPKSLIKGKMFAGMVGGTMKKNVGKFFKGTPIGNLAKSIKMPKLNFKSILSSAKSLFSLSNIFKTISKVGKIAFKGLGIAFKGLGKIFMANPIVRIISIIIGIILTLKKAWDNDFGGIKTTTLEVFDNVKNAIDSARETIEQVKETILGFVKSVIEKWTELKETLLAPVKAVVEVTDQMKEGKKASEGYMAKAGRAMGQRVIPYDNFPILAHQGETLLTANETRRKGADSNVIVSKLADTIVVREDADIDRIAEALLSKINKTRFNMA